MYILILAFALWHLIASEIWSNEEVTQEKNASLGSYISAQSIADA